MMGRETEVVHSHGTRRPRFHLTELARDLQADAGGATRHEGDLGVDGRREERGQLANENDGGESERLPSLGPSLSRTTRAPGPSAGHGGRVRWREGVGRTLDGAELRPRRGEK